MGLRIPFGQRGTFGQRRPVAPCEAVDKHVFALPLWTTPSQFPRPRGSSAINGAIFPTNHPLCFGNPQKPGLYYRQYAIGSAAPLQPALTVPGVETTNSLP